MTNYLFKPKTWGVWLVIGIMYFGSKLPIFFQKGIVLTLGFIIKPFLRSRNNIAKENLKIAYPEKSDDEIDLLVSKSYRSMVLSGLETTAAWFMTKKRFKKIDFEWEEGSLKLFKKYHDNPETNFIALGFHFHCIEIIGRYIGEEFPPFTVMYQKNSNELIEELIKKYREKNLYKCLDSKNFISVIKSLKKGYSMWYAPDQDFGLESSGYENSVFAPFFGEMCSTLTVTPWLAEKTKASVLPVYYVREKCLKKYKIVFGEPLEFTGDVYHDAKITNDFLESAVRKYPEQYLWQHRRFRTRPNGEPQIY
ncbi:lysophospholipid acyltransferase family protein [Francisella adeliensis]|uniref:LPS biosynthesis protein n=1 Tax=Francisella adeliensis TaxID=2007306 RepID=A0A2Z4XW44_9GAMM|nr:lysophospholipid acyltransferase family protein [Francisella adeliensis]AXA33057.1 LPS biosynthesis protein [Francisella adeliensis]MBK2086055.1 lysophospholipid acyltransferase family protein [Francisella adeliensis]MBK2096781.1 lysophospholipid acyltransferase family protein [Francisella adeliensis]QIW11284.1 lysophospholipid acyltransferase family protein [Francisella adeliensis]QIW13160.1 lysophospholipid acyltransferase family protein [Francisella adeliensis]